MALFQKRILHVRPEPYVLKTPDETLIHKVSRGDLRNYVEQFNRLMYHGTFTPVRAQHGTKSPDQHPIAMSLYKSPERPPIIVGRVYSMELTPDDNAIDVMIELDHEQAIGWARDNTKKLSAVRPEIWEDEPKRQEALRLRKVQQRVLYPFLIGSLDFVDIPLDDSQTDFIEVPAQRLVLPLTD